MAEETKRILVTGGAGFIGAHLCERLIEEGCEVVCVDNLFTGSRANIKHLLNNDRFEFIRHDIIQPLLVDVDQIYNLACPASPIHYQYNPVKTIQTNVVGVYNMVELARQVRARILQASTSEVYGDPTVHPQPESYWGNVNPVGPRSCYDEGKRCAETLLIDYYLQNRIEVRIARIFNTYGPKMAMNDGRVVSNFAIQALKGEPITIFGDGTQTRSFCYVDDLVEGLIRLMNYNGEDAHRPINLGNPEEHSILELARLIVQVTDTNTEISNHPLPQDDPKQRRPDINRARDCLGWQPTIAFEKGLKQTVAYFREKLSAQG
ncbi:MAG: SDR family oxidoreductase [Proteobacteria bacterium]|nr:SDR family oxidoreductase [Pseudomonadota bacterium]